MPSHQYSSDGGTTWVSDWFDLLPTSADILGRYGDPGAYSVPVVFIEHVHSAPTISAVISGPSTVARGSIEVFRVAVAGNVTELVKLNWSVSAGVIETDGPLIKFYAPLSGTSVTVTCAVTWGTATYTATRTVTLGTTTIENPDYEPITLSIERWTAPDEVRGVTLNPGARPNFSPTSNYDDAVFNYEVVADPANGPVGTLSATSGAHVSLTPPTALADVPTDNRVTIYATSPSAPGLVSPSLVFVYAVPVTAPTPTLTVAVAAANTSIQEGGSTGLTATLGGTATGNSTVVWSVPSGPGTITPTGLTATYNAPASVTANTEVTVRCTVTREGVTSFGEVNLTVTDVALPPLTVGLTSDQGYSVEETTAVTLRSSIPAAYQADASYAWSVTYNGSTQTAFSFSYPSPGVARIITPQISFANSPLNMTIRVVVTSLGVTRTASVVISVNHIGSGIPQSYQIIWSDPNFEGANAPNFNLDPGNPDVNCGCQWFDEDGAQLSGVWVPFFLDASENVNAGAPFGGVGPGPWFVAQSVPSPGVRRVSVQYSDFDLRAVATATAPLRGYADGSGQIDATGWGEGTGTAVFDHTGASATFAVSWRRGTAVVATVSLRLWVTPAGLISIDGALFFSSRSSSSISLVGDPVVATGPNRTATVTYLGVSVVITGTYIAGGP